MASVDTRPSPFPHREREQLLHFLTEAAELEHNLLCCYLYAAFSLKRGVDEDLTASECSAVDRWRKSILTVAREEMAHLAVVNNLISSIGGSAHFNRPNFPVAAGYHPAGIVVELSPFSMDTLDHFIFLERPSDAPLDDAESFQPPPQPARGAPSTSVMPGACDYSTISEFYTAIRTSFERVTASIGEKALFIGEPCAQISPELAGLPGVIVITDLASAVGAMDFIVVQGEGSGIGTEESHFNHFSAIKAEYENLLRERPAFSPARPGARNPVMRVPLPGLERVHVDEPQAAVVHDIANALYGLLLRLLTQCYGRPKSEVRLQSVLLDAAIQTMHSFGLVAGRLTRLPASATHPGVNAGVSFAMLRNIEALGYGRAERKVLAERCEELADAMNACDIAAIASGAHKLADLALKFRADPA